MSKVTVVIPCFNQGAYLQEAVESVVAQTFKDVEIIVVDDGSDDPETVQLLDRFEKTKVKLIRTGNSGLAAARNRGIREAKGEYIMPLDADDKISEGYAAEAIAVLDANPDIGIVYCEALHFGLRSERWLLPEFSLDRILRHNVIFCSAFFRKRDWDEVGGYNINMVYGWEDWDFWLSLIALGRKVYRIPKVLFHYRLKEASMIRSIDEEKDFFMRLHTCLNHRDLFRQVADIQIHMKIAELFFDTGFGIHPHQSMKTVVFADQRKVCFSLNPYRGIRTLRFDPINVPAFLHLGKIGIRDKDGIFHSLKVTRHNAIEQVGSDFLFDTSDPQMYFDLGNINDPVEFIAHIEFYSIGTDAFEDVMRCKDRDVSRLHNIVHQKETEIEKMKDEKSHLQTELEKMKDNLCAAQSILADRDVVITRMLQSTSWRITKPLRMLKERIIDSRKGS